MEGYSGETSRLLILHALCRDDFVHYSKGKRVVLSKKDLLSLIVLILYLYYKLVLKIDLASVLQNGLERI